jgi:hypothetical protein
MQNATLKKSWRTSHKDLGRRRLKSAPNTLFLQNEIIEVMLSSSYFPTRLKPSPSDHVPYSKQALKEDLLRLRNAWRNFQESRDRDAVYDYLSTVFSLVAWWTADGRALDRACWALRLQNADASTCNEAFAAVIFCTADPAKVDKRTRSKWSRVLRYALAYKAHSEPLDRFIKRKGGINECASRFAQRLGRRRGAALPI